MPSARSGSSLVKYFDMKTNRTRILLFGGFVTERLDELWECEISPDKEFKWKLIKPKFDKKEKILKRSGHTSIMYKNEMFVYGGIFDTDSVNDPVLIYNAHDKTYYQHKCYSKNEMDWRRNHSAECFGHHMLIYGGMDGEENVLNQTWILDLVSLNWYKIETKGPKFPPMVFHSSALVISAAKKNNPNFTIFSNSEVYPAYHKVKEEAIYYFGGKDNLGNYLNDVYVLRICRKPLERSILSITGSPPAPRSHCTINFYEGLNILILHGGRNDMKKSIFYNDFWVLDLVLHQWTKMTTFDGINKNKCHPRAEHCSIIVENYLLIFGGCDEKNFLGSDIMTVSLDLVETEKSPKHNVSRNSQIIKDNEILNEDSNSLINRQVNDTANRQQDSERKSSFIQDYLDRGEKIYEKMLDLNKFKLSNN